MSWKNMPDDKKLKLVYCGELVIFSIVFMVLGVLFLVGVITPANWKRYAFTYVTLGGSAYILVDFIWTLCSKKKRAKSCLLDKIMILPVAPVLMSFSIYCIVNGCAETLPYRYFIGADLCYLALVYLFQGIYHYYKPTPQMIKIIEQATEEEEEEQENTPENSPQEEGENNNPPEEK